MKALKLDVILLGVVLALVGMGIVIIYSSSAAYAETRHLPQHFYLFNHIKKVILGFTALVIGLSIPYAVWEKLARPMMYVSLAMLAFLVISGSVGQVNGAKRWIFGLQPSEIAKISLIFFMARFLKEKAEGIRDFQKGYLAAWAISGLTFLLILKQPNYSTAATIFAISLIMIFVGGCRISHLFLSALIALPALAALMVSSKYRLQRVMAFLKPEENLASSYQSLQALISLGNGGLWGTGLGTSTQKLGFLPMPFTDTIFSVLGEELGLVGTATCLLLFGLLLWRGLRIANRCAEPFGRLLAVGIIISIAVNVMIHVGVCTKLFPTTGQPLPFLSYGGTSLCVALFAMGVLLNISSAASGTPQWKVSKAASPNISHRMNLALSHRRSRA